MLTIYILGCYEKVPASNSNQDAVCELVVTENGLTASTSFSYLSSLTPTIRYAIPRRGGTGGGTAITIFGSDFP